VASRGLAGRHRESRLVLYDRLEVHEYSELLEKNRCRLGTRSPCHRLNGPRGSEERVLPYWWAQ
jgi:hypothetical protein